MDDDESIAEQFVKGSSITFVGLIIIGISQFVLRILLARGLSKSDFGLLFSVFTLLSFINIFSHLGLNQAATRFVSKYVAKKKFDKAKSSIISALGIVTIPSLLISGIVIALSGFLASSYFGTEKAVPVVIILSIWFLFMSYHNLLAGILRGLKDFLGKTISRLARNLVPLVGVVIALTFFRLDVNTAAIFYLLGPLISVLAIYVLLKNRHSDLTVKAKGAFSKEIGKKMMLFGAPLILSGIATSIIGKMDTMMLTGLRSLEDVGLYEIARVSQQALGFLGGALAIPLFPLVSELWAKNDIEGLRSMLNRITKFSFLGIFPAALIFFTFPEIIIRVLYGSDYLAAANAMRILAGGVMFWTIESVFVSSLSGIGKTTLVLKVNVAAAAFNVVANLLLIPPYGATGAAMATGISLIIGFGLGFYYSVREIGFSPSFSSLGKIGVGGLLTLILVFLLKSLIPLPTWPLLVTIMAVGVFFYGGWVFSTRIITREDLKLIEEKTPVPSQIISFLIKFLVIEES